MEGTPPAKALIMKRLISSLIGSSLLLCARPPAEAAPITLTEPQVPYSVPGRMWDLNLGQHRARVRVDQAAPAVRAHLPWRLQMKGMDTRQIVVVDVATGQSVRNVVRESAGRLAGDIVFQPATAPGDYYIYYLPLRPYNGLNDVS